MEFATEAIFQILPTPKQSYPMALDLQNIRRKNSELSVDIGIVRYTAEKEVKKSYFFSIFFFLKYEMYVNGSSEFG